ncbi:MAG: hypothetical protein CLLPBCKN_000692 [Chroococcidiopsis cubana SAG 39.79]|uniref:DUF2267 domain-containing protein n=1 Tax=Chroococcidiopsis cubana SAG 39.79 TaxID=388085 RepID=A0AB37UKJ3_9CYAN|nr:MULTISPECIES: DUF2267 domain-containing protein [Chroococcidiopsis]MBE9018901.1 DUF2267 domain-containing protein [Chroococcidiopsidales cyanobacterium LEGE 13417]MDZ4871304.1 hypothetical protein [Chroococcidiopsis cubana SAG 39.79]PSB63017.1 DUF2267 domain-containing protein [Chroococcidiopsis cubana CCALA 043]PSM49154.1 DUF2267 domain-containing protein [Chroococcidiopsis sp. CCALA 051]RUT11934.1 hypothetical protein DSM107010_27420 [Chroococcidiopsis cubana SAG 39.79]
MTIPLREDVAYIILKKINETGQELHPVKFTADDFIGREPTKAELLGHLDYLNQKQYIKAEFSGNAYGNQEDVPDAVNPKEVDFRVANTFGSSDGPLPHLITFKQAELTEKGRRMLEKMEAKPPEELKEGPSVPIATKDMPFLEKVMLKSGLEDLFDARDVTEVVYRVMRDLMTTEASDRVAEELEDKEVLPTEDKALQMEIADLWNDTNPIVRFLSRIRPPFYHSDSSDITNVNDNRFLARVKGEAPTAKTAFDLDTEQVVKAVFSATKDELSEERVKEIANCLPPRVRQMWETA